ncbi:MAG: alcohol dehydrogenase, partial [Planctomycetota bacterium]
MNRDLFLRLAIALMPILICCKTTRAEDWPQFLGKSRNGVSQEKSLVDSFPAAGPKIRWKVPGGVGMSAVVV